MIRSLPSQVLALRDFGSGVTLRAPQRASRQVWDDPTTCRRRRLDQRTEPIPGQGQRQRRLNLTTEFVQHEVRSAVGKPRQVMG